MEFDAPHQKGPKDQKRKRTNIPQHELDALARCLFPAIQAYFESEEGKKEFTEWKGQQKK